MLCCVCLVEVDVVGVDGPVEGDGDHLWHLVHQQVPRHPSHNPVKQAKICEKSMRIKYLAGYPDSSPISIRGTGTL